MVQHLFPSVKKMRTLISSSIIYSQIYFTVHKFIFQCTGISSQCSNIFRSAQIYFSVHKYISSAQIYFSVHKYISLLILVDLSAAFDTIDHEIMLEILETDFGVVDDAQKWIKSSLLKRQQCILVTRESSKAFGLDCGVPQGSCLGPVLFLLYASRLFHMVSKHLPTTHAYADDKQLYFSFRPDSSAAQDDVVKAMEECITDVRSWLVSQRLVFNDMKTEFVIIGFHQQLSKVTINSVKVVVKGTKTNGHDFSNGILMEFPCFWQEECTLLMKMP